MTDQATSSSGDPAPVPATQRRRWPLLALIAVVAALTGAATTYAFSQVGFGPPHWGPAGFIGGWGGRFDPAQAEERVDRMVRHLAIEIDANAQQQEKLRGIARAAVKDLVPMREKAVAARERAPALLTQPTIDRAAIEAFRAEQIALADAASKRIAQALADAAEVLTPEQRRKIDEYVTARRAFWRSWHHG
jgi:Spy/CpxP family protein refolding chaperone